VCNIDIRLQDTRSEYDTGFGNKQISNSVQNPVQNLSLQKNDNFTENHRSTPKIVKNGSSALKLKGQNFQQEKKNFHPPITNPNIPFSN